MTDAPEFEVADVRREARPERRGQPDSRSWAATCSAPPVFAALRETRPDDSGEIQLADALRRVLERGGRVLAVPLVAGERRHDIGSVEGYCATFLDTR